MTILGCRLGEGPPLQAIELLGVPGSPYTRKMMALLRYRRLPFQMLWGTHFDPPEGYPSPKVKLLPTLYWRTATGCETRVDSTPLISWLETEFSGRSVQPEDTVLHVLNLLIEDFADEWLTKAMFHYRWHFAPDAEHAAPLLAFWQDPQLPAANAQQVGRTLAQRQTSRLSMVGSNPITAPVIESSYERLIGILDRIIERQGFVLGSRPASADFGLYGQLTQLGLIDPTPSRMLDHHSPRLRAWLDRLEDLSGHAPGPWIERSSVTPHLGELLCEIGLVYAPFLVANAQAYHAGHAEFETLLDGRQWVQPVFAYQVKCLQTLRQARLSLNAADREDLDQLLAGTGCERMFNL